MDYEIYYYESHQMVSTIDDFREEGISKEITITLMGDYSSSYMMRITYYKSKAEPLIKYDYPEPYGEFYGNDAREFLNVATLITEMIEGGFLYNDITNFIKREGYINKTQEIDDSIISFRKKYGTWKINAEIFT